jgi:hypothetical protein
MCDKNVFGAMKAVVAPPVETPQEMREVFEELAVAPAANIKCELDTLGQRLGSARGSRRC